MSLDVCPELLKLVWRLSTVRICFSTQTELFNFRDRSALQRLFLAVKPRSDDFVVNLQLSMNDNFLLLHKLVSLLSCQLVEDVRVISPLSLLDEVNKKLSVLQHNLHVILREDADESLVVLAELTHLALIAVCSALLAVQVLARRALELAL